MVPRFLRAARNLTDDEWRALIETVEAGAIRGRSPIGAAASLNRILRGLVQARSLLRQYRPDVVLVNGVIAWRHGESVTACPAGKLVS